MINIKRKCWVRGITIIQYLLNLNFSSNEPLLGISQEGVTSLAQKEEPKNLYCLPEVSEDSHLLFPVEEFYDILQSGTQSHDVFGELNMGDMGAFGYQQGDMFADLNNNDEYAPNVENTNTWTGIQRRDREVKPYSATTSKRIRLQVSKMESRNRETLSGTIRINQDVHLDPYDEKQAVASRASRISVPKDVDVNVNASKRSTRSGSSCLRGFMNCFFLFACMMGTAALIFFFLLRDARRLIGSSSALEL